MGCDIHAIVEDVEVSAAAPTPDWAYSNWTRFDDLGRFYAIFGFLAGVRHDGPPVVEKRGKPADLRDGNYDPADDYATFGDHSHSWLTPDEYAEVLRRFDALRTAEGFDAAPTEYHAVLDYMRALERAGRV